MLYSQIISEVFVAMVEILFFLWLVAFLEGKKLENHLISDQFT